jgi:hypothetical protein
VAKLAFGIKFTMGFSTGERANFLLEKWVLLSFSNPDSIINIHDSKKAYLLISAVQWQEASLPFASGGFINSSSKKASLADRFKNLLKDPHAIIIHRYTI